MVDLSFLLDWPQSYNTLAILLSLLVLGAGCAAVGSFAILNQQALISDVAAHATLPGVAIGFLLTVLWDVQNDVAAISLMLLCAALCGSVGIMLVQSLAASSRLRVDAAMGVVLSGFYGLGLVLFSMIQRIEGVSAAGLDRFLLGQVTGITAAESLVIFVLSLLALGGTLLFMRPLSWLCFDPNYLKAHHPRLKAITGWLLTALIIVIICAGLRTVGLVLFVALMIIPVSSFRPWARSVAGLVLAAVLIGVGGSYIGVQFSAHHANVPAGAAVVLSCAGLFGLSIVLMKLTESLRGHNG